MKQRKIKFRFILQQEEGNRRDYCYRTLEQLLKDNFICNDKWKIIAKNESTGLKDKNRKEIYEGDIVDIGHKQYNFEIIFNKGMFGVLDRTAMLIELWKFENFEIIGNIYENPELLNKKEVRL